MASNLRASIAAFGWASGAAPARSGAASALPGAGSIRGGCDVVSAPAAAWGRRAAGVETSTAPKATAARTLSISAWIILCGHEPSGPAMGIDAAGCRARLGRAGGTDERGAGHRHGQG